MARFWTADLHLGHSLVSGLRGFATTDEHDAHLLGQIRKLKPGDELWILGDISSGQSENEQRALELLVENCRAAMHLIAGNHDSVSSIHRGGYKKQAEWMRVFASVQQFGRMRLNRRDVLMSHYPYARSNDGPGRGAARYAEYRLPDLGLPLIHGHTHQSEPHMPQFYDLSEELDGSGNVQSGWDTSQFCVSWDAHRRLVTEGDLNTWLSQEAA